MKRDGRHKEKESLARDILFTLAINFAVALLITLAFAFGASGIKDLGNRFIASLIISNSIGFLVMLALIFLGPYMDRWPAPLNWILAVCSLVACTAVGFLIGGTILTRTGLMPEIYFWASFKDSIGVALIISLGIGISAALYEQLRSRLEATTLRLREQELAEERARKLAAEARLASLESRIHPHFLFNTLNSISSLIQDDPRQAELMVERLAALLRFSLDAHQSSAVPLDRELKIVRDYLEIEKARFGPRLRYHIDVESALTQSIEVPPLAIQTLVENSIKHVISRRREGGEIRIKARLDGGIVYIEVSDDGPGFSLEDISAGHGLDNLRARLAALFGDEAALGVPERGKVSIKAPHTAAHASPRPVVQV
jgi:sensor histidine kinase YesM